MELSIDTILTRAGTGPFQKHLLGIFGLVWAADAMQVLAVGFTATSIAATFGLSIPEALQTGTLFFLGMLIGAYGFGKLADKFGRRNILLITVACDAVFGLLSVFAPSFGALLALRFLTGAAVGGTLPVDYAMMAEFLPPKKRGKWLVGLESFWAVGTIIVSLAAWAASAAGAEDAWRWVFAVTAFPAIIGFYLRFGVPESPLFLMKSGKMLEAKNVFNQMLLRNGQQQLGETDTISLPSRTASYGLLSPELRKRTLLIMGIWFLTSLSYYGVFVWLPARLAGEGFGFVKGYGFLVAVALAQLPGYALAAYGVDAWGRRPTLIAFLLFSALGCFLFVIVNNPILVAISIMIMSFALLGTWGALYAFTPELYPTEYRATGMGTAGAVARFGGLLAPSAMALLFIQSFTGALALFAGLLVIGALLGAFIDIETKDTSLS
ncbi:MFS transporter [Microvirga sp. W0021]|uniref:MFS transporter n=1 Tax=Hohaiivirga grylli TaxID=3133970 RepID=A0ABV0BII3_9HYPH